MKKALLVILALIPIILYGTITIAAAQGNLPATVINIYKLPGGDKAGHLIVMAMISFTVLLIVRLLLPQLKRLKGSLITIVLLFLMFTIEEFSQRYVPRRTFSLIDLYFSYGGAVIGILLATLCTLKRRKEPAS